MDEWFSDSSGYPRIHISREERGAPNPYNRSASTGNVIRIRVHGRRSMERELSDPQISIKTFNNEGSRLGSSPVVTVESSGYNSGSPIQVKHVTSNHKINFGSPAVPTSVNVSRRPMRVTPLTSLRTDNYDSSSNRDFGAQYRIRRILSSPPTSFFDTSNVFDSFQKEFDQFASDSKARVFTQSHQRSRSGDWNSALGCERPVERGFTSHYHHRYTPKRHASEEININTTTIRSNYPSTTSETTSPQANDGSSWGNPEHKHSTMAIAKAKRVLDRVLRDLEDSDSGYSGSGDTRAGFTLSSDEIKARIKRYNDSHKNTKITQSESDTFQGDIQVNLCLDQTVEMMLQTRPITIYDALNRNTIPSSDSVKASVTLPKNTTMGLHVSSHDNASNIIEQLLQKFNILNDPKEFALYEQTLEMEKEVKLRRVASSEKPLLNFLKWNTEGSESKRFVLKEEDTAEIMWEAFSIPELTNFLKMLDLEKKNQMELIRERFTRRRAHMEARLKETTPASTDTVCQT